MMRRMCGRYVLRRLKDWLDDAFAELKIRPDLSFLERYNIAPTQNVPAVRWEQDGPTLVNLRWGLIPSWAKDPSIGNRMVNARAESLAAKPAFRTAFQRRRCLIPADGFYEWQTRAGQKQKQPHLIYLKNDRPFAFAGIWDRWETPNETIESFSIITTQANSLIKPIHDRMPVILTGKNLDLWIRPIARETELTSLLVSYDATAMTHYPVSTTVNSPRNDDPSCMAPFKENSLNSLWPAVFHDRKLEG